MVVGTKKELLRVADAVIGHEEDNRIVEQLFLFKTCEDVADFLVRVAAAVEVVGPVLKDHGVARIVGG